MHLQRGLSPACILIAALTIAFGSSHPALCFDLPWVSPATGSIPEPTVAKPPVVSIPSPNYFDRWGGVIDMIVIHDTQSPGVRDARTIARYFARPSSRRSAHYVIGKDGLIVQCVPDELAAWHAGPSYFKGQDHLNNCAIGIELVTAETGRDPFTNAQYRALVRLVSYLVGKYHVPMDRIVGHKDITTRKHDPARNFSWARLRVGVQEALATTSIQVTSRDATARAWKGGQGS